jgi:hypothetical protein
LQILGAIEPQDCCIFCFEQCWHNPIHV